jgi:hypothetical protein
MRIDMAPARSADGKRSAVVLTFSDATSQLNVTVLMDVPSARVVVEKLPAVIDAAESVIVAPDAAPLPPIPFRKN